MHILRQDLRFLAPVRPSDTVHAQITISDANPDKKRVFGYTVCCVGDTPVVRGMLLCLCLSAARLREGAFLQRRFSAFTEPRPILRTNQTTCVFYVTSKRPRMT